LELATLKVEEMRYMPVLSKTAPGVDLPASESNAAWIRTVSSPELLATKVTTTGAVGMVVVDNPYPTQE
jgi:hypothetical protein